MIDWRASIGLLECGLGTLDFMAGGILGYEE